MTTKNKKQNSQKTMKSRSNLRIFADFDGVCNSYKEGSYRTNDDETYGPSKTICNRIRKICEDTGAKIIISSNWRKFDPDGCYTFGKQTVHNPLKKHYNEIGDLIVGTLPPVRHVTKAEALILWLEENEVDNFVILDDDPRENLGSTYDHDIRYHYIETDPEFGITEEIAEKIKNILNS